jgi:hypothetical protein
MALAWLFLALASLFSGQSLGLGKAGVFNAQNHCRAVDESGPNGWGVNPTRPFRLNRLISGRINKEKRTRTISLVLRCISICVLIASSRLLLSKSMFNVDRH